MLLSIRAGKTKQQKKNKKIKHQQQKKETRDRSKGVTLVDPKKIKKYKKGKENSF